MALPSTISDAISNTKSDNTMAATSIMTPRVPAAQAVYSNEPCDYVAQIERSSAIAALLLTFALPRELRDTIYEYVLANAGTLFLGIPPPSTTSKANEATSTTESSKDAAATLVDVRFQQKLAPLPLLGVSRATRSEFLTSMARHVNATASIFFTQEPDFWVSHAMLQAQPHQTIPSSLITSLAPSTSFSYSQIRKLFLDAMCLIMKWQSDQGLLIQGIVINWADDNDFMMSWTCSKTRDLGYTTIEYELGLAKEIYEPSLYTFRMEIARIRHWWTDTSLAVYFPESKLRDKSEEICMFLEHQIHDDQIVESMMSRSQAVDRAESTALRHAKTPGEVLVLMIQDTLSHHGIRKANGQPLIAWPIRNDHFFDWLRRVGPLEGVSLSRPEKHFHTFSGPNTMAESQKEWERSY